MSGSDNPFYRCSKFGGKKIHLGVSGSVACYKACELLRMLQKLDIHVSSTITAGGKLFVTPMLLQALGAYPVYDEMTGDPEYIFGHLEPGQAMDAMVVCPASADLLARMAMGLANDMLSAQYVAFAGPVIIAPAMNPRMWSHAATRDNVKLLMGRGCKIVEPDTGETAEREVGQGRLAKLPEIFLNILKALSPQDMAGLKVMVTLGPTREFWDGARFWSNPSSGRMGVALATSAWLRGAEVWAICGPGVEPYLPLEITRCDVLTAREMYEQAARLWPQMNVGIFSAAVADYSPCRPVGGDGVKIKKSTLRDGLKIAFESNPDILATLAGQRNNGQRVLGFAAEITPDMAALQPLAAKKLVAKKADIIAANRVNMDEGSFGSATGTMAVADINGREEIWSPKNKADIAWDLCSWLLTI